MDRPPHSPPHSSRCLTRGSVVPGVFVQPREDLFLWMIPLVSFTSWTISSRPHPSRCDCRGGGPFRNDNVLDNAPPSPSRLSSLTQNNIPLRSPLMRILEPMRPKVYREDSVSGVECLSWKLSIPFFVIYPHGIWVCTLERRQSSRQWERFQTRSAGHYAPARRKTAIALAS